MQILNYIAVSKIEMKNLTQLKYHFLLFFLVTTWHSCKKDPSLDKSKKALLISEAWQMVDYKVNNIRFYGVLSECQKDNNRIFKADGTYSLEEGPTKCKVSNPQIIQQDNYELIKNETVIKWRRVEHKIVVLSETKLTLTFYDQRDFYELFFEHP